MRTKAIATLGVLLTVAEMATAQISLPAAPMPISAPPPQIVPQIPNLSKPPMPPGVTPMQSMLSPVTTTQLWFSAEYLIWWLKDGPMPVPVLTSADPFDVNPGALGQPGTRVLLGGSDVDNKTRNGGRFNVGYWFDGGQTAGMEATYFFLARRTITETVGASGAADSPIIGVPFFDVAGIFTPSGQPGEAFFPLSLPGMFAGTGTLSLSSFLQGAELNGVFNLTPGGAMRFQVISGFRYLELDEKLGLSYHLEPTGSFAGTMALQTADQFDCRNRFYGGQAGGRLSTLMGKLFVDVTGKIALGTMHEAVDVGGQNTLTVLGGSMTSAGALFSQPTNLGHRSRDKLAFIPEATCNVGYQFNEYFRVFAGYNFLFANNVLRPGDQIDRQINLTQSGGGPLVGAARPSPILNGSSFWAQGVNLGMELRY